ncbi:ubiquinone biosynthesis accessory factor UbiJ [Thorsellia kenyensis]|uniref:SCP2 domain-containing protein n=1 Tax=Thorsellia kenyensis TaxID=1549888 RepID=A0ABV6CEB9_9GAMM
MNKFFDAFNEFPKPEFVKKLPPLESLAKLAPEIPGIVSGILKNKNNPFSEKMPTDLAKKNLLRVSVMIVETIINKHIYKQQALSKETEKLQGKSLELYIKEIGHALTLVFTTSGVDILIDAEYQPDCRLMTSLKTLKRLKDKTVLTDLIKTEQIDVEGDFTVLQDINQLIDKVEPGIGAILSPITGDLAASVIESVAKKLNTLFSEKKQLFQSCFTNKRNRDHL